MLTNPPIPYDLCVGIPIPNPNKGLLRDCKISRKLREGSFEALIPSDPDPPQM